jgi:hypothetical protein
VLFILPPALGVALGLLLGGSSANWGNIRVRWPWLIVVVLVVRIAIGFSPVGTIDALRYVYILTIVGFLVWALMQFRALPGIWIAVIGAAMNLLVMLANGGHMPVSPVSGFTPAHAGGLYIVGDSTTSLNWLGDWIGIPGILGGAASPGDFLIALGVGVTAFLITRRRPPATKLLEETTSSMGR